MRLIIVEDHEVVRIGLRRIFEGDSEISVVGEASNCEDAKSVAEAEQPDVVLLDMRLPDGNGADACREILRVVPAAQVLILTSFPEKKPVMDALNAGASGFMLKDSPAPEIRDAIHSVSKGKYLLDPKAMSWVMPGSVHDEKRGANSDGAVLESLTGRQREILELIGEGLTNQQIAGELCLSLQTVKNYVSSLLTKLTMSRRSEAAAFIARVSAEESFVG